MSIAGGKIRYDVLEAEYDGDKRDRLERHDERQKRKLERHNGNLKRLLSEAWGRELLWDIIIDAHCLKLNPYTRNADTYYILGMQRVARVNMEVVKELDFENYQKMEKEARNRDKREEEERNG